MKSSLALVLPREIPEDCEGVVLEHIKMKIKIACSFMTRVVRALEQRYGAEVLEVARKAILESAARDPSEIGAPGEDLHVYLKDLEKAFRRGWIAQHEPPRKLGLDSERASQTQFLTHCE